MNRTKVWAGAVIGGVMLVSAMGCQQAPAPTVVVEHQNDGHDRDRQQQEQAQRDQAQRDQAQRDQAQRDQDHRNPPPPPPRPQQ